MGCCLPKPVSKYPRLEETSPRARRHRGHGGSSQNYIYRAKQRRPASPVLRPTERTDSLNSESYSSVRSVSSLGDNTSESKHNQIIHTVSVHGESECPVRLKPQPKSEPAEGEAEHGTHSSHTSPLTTDLDTDNESLSSSTSSLSESVKVSSDIATCTCTPNDASQAVNDMSSSVTACQVHGVESKGPPQSTSKPRGKRTSKPRSTASIKVCESDLPILLEVLADYAHKWREIGQVLGFSFNELDVIACKPKLFVNAPNSWLAEILRTWVQWSPQTQHAKHPTLHDLLKVLRSRTVGLAAVAEEIKKAIKGTSRRKTTDDSVDAAVVSATTQESKPLDPSTCRRADCFITQVVDHMHIAVDEAAAVIRYLQIMDVKQIKRLGGELGLCTFNLEKMKNLPDDMVRAWFRREDNVIKKCGDQLTWEVLVKALRKIGQAGVAADIHRDQCGKSGSPQLDLKPERQLGLQNPVQRYAMYLKGVYKSAMMSSDKLPNLSCNEFINLALVKGDQVSLSPSEADEFTKATLHGHVDEIMKQKEPIKLEEVLKPLEGQQKTKCVYMYGAPGVGKSTCVGELCRRWDEIDALKKYSLIILLRLCEKRVQEAIRIKDLCFHSDKDLQQAVAAKIEAYEGEDVLFILDGFDELPASLQKHSMFVELIRGTYLSHCTVLVTSRPSATADLAVAQPQIHKQIEVIGFTQAHIEQYAKLFFASRLDILADFLTYISTHPAIRSLLYIPLNCAITAETYRHNRTVNRPIPQTMTQLYTELSLTLLQRHLHVGEDNPLAEQFPERLIDLPPQLLKPLCLLAEQAFKGLEINEVIFHNLPSSFVHFGFMNSPTELYLGRKVPVSHSFLHRTLQEFLAAFHISQLQPSDQKRLFYKHCETAGWDVIWSFVAGLTGFQGMGWEVVQLKRGRDVYRRVTPFLILCLYEAQKKADCDSVLEDSIVYYDGLSSLTAVDCYALSYCLINSKYLWKLYMNGNKSLGRTLIETLQHGLFGSPSNSQSQKERTNILSLDLQTCGLNSTTFNLLADMLPLMTNLRGLDISYNPAGNGGLVKLIQSLFHLKHLEILRMSFTEIDRADFEALSCWISPSSNLKELVLGDVDMSPETTELMLKTVLSPSSLESVEFHGVKWTGQVVTLLEENKNLTKLTVHESSPALIASVAIALCKNSHLEIFSVQAVLANLDDDALSSIVKMIHSNQKLETMLLFPALAYPQLLALDDALQPNHTLKTIVTSRPLEFNLEPKTIDPRITLC